MAQPPNALQIPGPLGQEDNALYLNAPAGGAAWLTGADTVARQRAQDIANGLVDPNTGQLTPAGMRAQAQAVLMGFGPSDIGAMGGGFMAGLKNLPMDVASRMERARAMGFDTANPMYHATPYDFAEFKPSNWRGGSYFAPTPEGAMRGASSGGMEHPALAGPTAPAERGGMQIIPAYLGGKIWGRDPLPEGWLPQELTYGQYKAIASGQDKIELPGLSKAENAYVNLTRQRAAQRHYTEAVPESEWHNYAGENEHALPMKLESQPVAEPFWGYESIEGGDYPSPYAASGSMAPAEQRALLQRLGYSGWVVKDEGGHSIAMADPSKIRATSADFDPSKAASRNMLYGAAGLAGGAAVANRRDE
jgi:hypothetical protein